MLIDFSAMAETTIPHLNNGEGIVSAKMFMQPNVKVMISRLPVGSSIGLHQHTSSYELNYVLSGSGIAICDGVEEALSVGTCQYCPQGSSHSLINSGKTDLVLFTVVPEQ